jgi:hypothetical protein
MLISMAAGLAALALGSGCSMDIFDVDVDLPSASFAVDFGSLHGTIPAIPCNASAAAPCSVAGMNAFALGDTGATGPVDARITARCDAARAQCFAEASARMAVTLNTVMGDDFGAKVARRGVKFVRGIDVRYVVTANSLTFDLPEVSVYVGPPGTHVETDPGVAAAGHMGPVTAGAPSATVEHLFVEDGTPAHTLVQQSVRSQSQFVLMLTCAPRIDAGAALPAGALQVEVFPRVTLGLR